MNMNRNQDYDVFIVTGADLTNKLSTYTHTIIIRMNIRYTCIILKDEGGPRRTQIKPSHEDDR